MNGIKYAVVLAVGLVVARAGMATAGRQRPYRVSDQQLKDLVDRIDTHKGAFHDASNGRLTEARSRAARQQTRPTGP